MNIENMMDCSLQVQIKNQNLPIDLNEKYTANFHICEKLHNIITLQFNDFSLANEKITMFELFKPAFTCMQTPSFCEKLYLKGTL